MNVLDFFYRLSPFRQESSLVKDNRTRAEIVRDATARFTIQEPPGQRSGVLNWMRQAVGGWLGPAESHGRSAGRYITGEKAAGGPRGVMLPAFLPFIDEQTGETETMRLWYRRMLRDPIIKAALLGKTFDVASLDLHVNAIDHGNSKDRLAAKFCDWNLNKRLKGRIPQLMIDILLPGLIDGYSVCEKVWEYQEQGRYEGKYVLDRLKQKDTGNDVVLVIDEFRNITGVLGLRYNAGYVFSPSDFAIFRYMPLYEYPGGMSDLRAIYTDYWMYDTVRKLRAIHAEKRAMPVLRGTYKDLSQRPALENVLSRIRWDNWIAAPEWAKVEALEFAGAAADIYDKMITDLKENIFIGIQGSSLQALVNKGGSNVRGDSSVQKSTSELFNWYLMAAGLAVLNEQLVPDMCDLNYAGLTGYPEAVMGGINEGELGKALAVDSGLIDKGLDLSKEYAYKKYGREKPRDANDVWKASPAPAPGGNAGNPTGGEGAGIQEPKTPPVPALAERPTGGIPIHAANGEGRKLAERVGHHLREMFNAPAPRKYAEEPLPPPKKEEPVIINFSPVINTGDGIAPDKLVEAVRAIQPPVVNNNIPDPAPITIMPAAVHVAAPNVQVAAPKVNIPPMKFADMPAPTLNVTVENVQAREIIVKKQEVKVDNKTEVKVDMPKIKRVKKKQDVHRKSPNGPATGVDSEETYEYE